MSPKPKGEHKKLVFTEKSSPEDKLGSSPKTDKEKKGKPAKVDEKDLTPYREIILSDGHGFYIKTVCNLTPDERVHVQQYREHIDPEGTKFACTEPTFFENKTEFLDWLIEMVKKNFDEIPYITITPLEMAKIKKHERDATDTMYL
jgi:hypothetical protein